jgi:hypothetical protein
VIAIVLETETTGKYNIIACIIWYHEEAACNFIPLVAVLDCTGDDGYIKLSNKTFKLGKDNQTHMYMLPNNDNIRSFQNLDL